MESVQINPSLNKIILESIGEGDLKSIKSNLKKNHIDISLLKDAQNGQNAYFFAATIKNDLQALEVFKYFKELGLDPNCKDRIMQTPLYYTCREGKNLCTKFLVEECHLKVNEIDIYGQTPLYYCTRDNKKNTVELMIKLGANINSKDKYGQTCLFYAIREGHYDVVELLLEKGADINLMDKKRRTPYDFAEKYNFPSICELLKKFGVKSSLNSSNIGKRSLRDRRIIHNCFLGKYVDSKKNQNYNDDKSNKDEKKEDFKKIEKYYLVKIGNGKKIPLSNEEIRFFKREHEEIYNYLIDISERCKLIDKMTGNYSFHTTEPWEKIAKKLINTLWKVKGANMFHKPVNPIELDIPDYPKIIKKPMDFSTVKRKLSLGEYENVKEFLNDINLTFDNCHLFNGVKSTIGITCSKVKKEFNNLFNQLNIEKYL